MNTNRITGNAKFLTVTLGLLLLGTGCYHGYYHGRVVVVDEPPRPRREVVIERPSGEHIWVEGRWEHRDGHYEWFGGRWERRPQHDAVWVQGYWERLDHGWLWHEGHWR